jgi:hypothetical protein
LHHITSGSIKCGLNGDQAMKHASGTDPLDPQQASYDLLVDIRATICHSPISWKFFWIKGHQKEPHGKSDAWGKSVTLPQKSTGITFAILVGTPRVIKLTARDQDAIGWNQFMQGRLSTLWEDAQEKWISANTTKYKRSSAR